MSDILEKEKQLEGNRERNDKRLIHSCRQQNTVEKAKEELQRWKNEQSERSDSFPIITGWIKKQKSRNPAYPIDNTQLVSVDLP